MFPRRRAEWVAALRERRNTLRWGQLDNREFEALLAGIVEREWEDVERPRVVVEVGTGGGRGSTAAIHRVLSARRVRFRLVGYEGNAEMASKASRYWSDSEDVQIVNEYFMRREDIDAQVKPRVAPEDRMAYLPEFDAVARSQNFMATAPPGAIDLLFIDSVRYTHLAILRAAEQWLQPETVVVMEDDIPGYGELAIIESELGLRNVARHEIRVHPWPLVEFKIAPAARGAVRGSFPSVGSDA